MQAFGAHLQQLIGRLSNPNEVCRSIDLCYQAGQLHLLGGHKCTFGPTYWCYTAAHAESCKVSLRFTPQSSKSLTFFSFQSLPLLITGDGVLQN